MFNLKSKKRVFLPILAVFLFLGLVLSFSASPDVSEVEEFEYDACTSILVGKLASIDGSTMTSHSCDSNSDRTWINVVPHMKHKAGDTCKIYFRAKNTKEPNDPDRLDIGEIPQVPETYAYINTAYPIMNEYQLAIGETTFGGNGS